MLEMKAYIKILIIIVITFGLTGWIRNSFNFGHIARTLPFCGGEEVSPLYTVSSAVLLLLMFWGFHRLKKPEQTNDQYEINTDDHETDYQENDDSYYSEK
jgi:hypothetical protein